MADRLICSYNPLMYLFISLTLDSCSSYESRAKDFCEKYRMSLWEAGLFIMLVDKLEMF